MISDDGSILTPSASDLFTSPKISNKTELFFFVFRWYENKEKVAAETGVHVPPKTAMK